MVRNAFSPAAFLDKRKGPCMKSDWLKHWKQNGLVALAIVLFSELGLHFVISDFRISLAVVLFPFFLLTISRETPAWEVGATTGLAVWVFRVLYATARGTALAAAARANLPGGLYYIFYGVLFGLIVRQRYVYHYNKLWYRIALCDLLANISEVLVRLELEESLHFYLILAAIALGRGVLTIVLLAVYGRYHDLLTHAEHEERYQRLFLMKTSLRTELYFMQKSCGNIEGIVKNAYTLYEKLSLLDIPPEVKKLALYIACDVHDVTKDYLRITQGIQTQLGEDGEDTLMRFADLLHILRESTYRMLEQEKLDIRLDFEHSVDFTTRHHYLLMSVLRCLVNNSIEAITSAGVKPGSVVRIRADRVDGDYLLQVSDNGPGIAPDQLDKVFQMGYSTKFDSKTGNIYRGMGLTGAKMSLEEQLGGSIWVDSIQNERTTFWVRVPAANLTETAKKTKEDEVHL